MQLERGSKGGTLTAAEHRIRHSVRSEKEKIWKDRMEKEDKITTNSVETLKSQVLRLNEEVVCMKNRLILK